MVTTPSSVPRSVASRGRSLGISERRIDFYARSGLMGVGPVGSGRRRDWSQVSDRRLAACGLATTAAALGSIEVKRALVNELDRKGWVEVTLKCGTIRLTLPVLERVA